jgi:hypothetical protein
MTGTGRGVTARATLINTGTLILDTASQTSAAFVQKLQSLKASKVLFGK